MEYTEFQFLKESNNIEDEWSDSALIDAIEAWEYLKSKKQLSLEIILEAHRLLMQTRNVPNAWKGKLRTGKVWVGGKEKLDFRKIFDELNPWIKQVNTVGASDGLHPAVVAEICQADHVNFEEIHPFFDGNGRLGRMLLNWERVWGELPILVIKEKEKHWYYEWFK